MEDVQTSWMLSPVCVVCISLFYGRVLFYLSIYIQPPVRSWQFCSFIPCCTCFRLFHPATYSVSHSFTSNNQPASSSHLIVLITRFVFLILFAFLILFPLTFSFLLFTPTYSNYTWRALLHVLGLDMNRLLCPAQLLHYTIHLPRGLLCFSSFSSLTSFLRIVYFFRFPSSFLFYLSFLAPPPCTRPPIFHRRTRLFTFGGNEFRFFSGKFFLGLQNIL